MNWGVYIKTCVDHGLCRGTVLILLGDSKEDQEKSHQPTSYPGRNLGLGSLDEEEEMPKEQLRFLFLFRNYSFR